MHNGRFISPDGEGAPKERGMPGRQRFIADAVGIPVIVQPLMAVSYTHLKNPHPNFLVGGMACAINMNNDQAINQFSLS